MPVVRNPIASDVHENRFLQRHALNMLRDENYLYDTLLPKWPTQHQTDKYRYFSRGDFRRDLAVERAPATRAPKIGWKFDQRQFSVRVWSIASDVEDQAVANKDPDLPDLYIQATRLGVDTQKVRLERLLADLMFTSGNWNYGTHGADSAHKLQIDGEDVAVAANASIATPHNIDWSAQSQNPAFFQSVKLLNQAFSLKTGYRFNSLLCSQRVIDELEEVPEVQDRIDGGNTGRGLTANSPGDAQFVNPNLDILRFGWGIANINVMESTYNQAVDDGADEDFSFMAGNDVILYYQPRGTVSPGSPVIGACYSWTGYMKNTNQEGMRIKRWDDIAREVTTVEVNVAKEFLPVAPDLAYYLVNPCRL